MTRPLKFRDFAAIMRRFGITCRQSRHKSTHYILSKAIEGVTCTYCVAVRRGEVNGVYIAKTRRAFRLQPKDGVSDKDFFGR